MSMHYEIGNLLDSNCSIICHQVNCQGKMNSGIAKAIKEKWPIVFERYEEWYMSCKIWARINMDEINNLNINATDIMLGNIQIVPVPEGKTIINMAAQDNFGYDGRRYTSYDAFWSCLGKIKNAVPKGSTIGFPDHIGSCRGGANWNIIKTMIEEVLSKDYEVYIYKLEE